MLIYTKPLFSWYYYLRILHHVIKTTVTQASLFRLNKYVNADYQGAEGLFYW